MKNTINIFSETGCIPHEILWKYRQGKLTASEKHAVEVHLTDCELCSDALAGMMDMNSDEMIAGLRKSVRNISAPKKVIRFYDYRVLSAAAAIAVLFVFAYVINSNKNDTKEIAQLVKPEPKKSEQQVSIDIVMPRQDTASALTTKESLADEKGINVSDEMAPPVAVVEENLAVIPVKQSETDVLKDADSEDAAVTETASGYAAPAQTAAPASRDEEKALASSSTKNQMRKKSAANDESSKVMYFNNLKVARTPAMSPSENLDSVNTGTPAMNENIFQQSAEVPAREMPFVYSKTLRDGMNYFHNKQYYEASQTFSIILERFPNDVNSQFYKGLSEMEMQNYSPSVTLLNKAMLNSDKTFYEEAKFKLALCYIALHQTKDAEKLLKEIKAEKGLYSEKATEELQRLK